MRRWTAGVAAVVAAGLLAGTPPAESGQRANPDAPLAAQGDTGERGRARRDDVLRRRQALRERQDELRRARQAARRGPMSSEPFTAVARIGRQGTLNLVNVAGSVTLTGSGGNDVRVEAVKRVWDRSDAAARAALSDVHIEVTERRGAVDIRSDVGRPDVVDAEVDFTIAVPAGANVSVRTGSGDVTVTGIRGELRAEAVAGSIKATSVGQVRMLRTLGGAIMLENADSSDVTVSTLGGAVTIRQLKARSADLRTVSGDLIVTDSEAERLIAQSLSGRLELTGRLAPAGRYSLQSQSGDVRFTPLGSDNFELEAASVAGSVRSDFPITLEERRDLAGRSGRGRLGRSGGRGPAAVNARIVRGVSGSGGPLVTLRSFRGDITIARP
jgi:DUF4097 and DUF4098 domain-containing protein YvlB